VDIEKGVPDVWRDEIVKSQTIEYLLPTLHLEFTRKLLINCLSRALVFTDKCEFNLNTGPVRRM
jgi:hypothetical protein